MSAFIGGIWQTVVGVQDLLSVRRIHHAGPEAVRLYEYAGTILAAGGTAQEAVRRVGVVLDNEHGPLPAEGPPALVAPSGTLF